MTEETTQDTASETTQDASQGANISLEQVFAAYVNKNGAISLYPADLFINFSNKMVSVNQDPETQLITFDLVDMPTQAE